MQNMSGGKSTFGLDANVVALLCYVGNFCCYLGLILSIITVIQDKTNKLARFHAFQSIVLSAAILVISFVLGAFNGVAAASRSTVLSLLVMGIGIIVSLGILIVVIYSGIQGYQGKLFKLPVIGDMADKWSN